VNEDSPYQEFDPDEEASDDEVYRVRLENVFEGPMDLLVYLIKKHEVDIWDIPVALITSQ